MVLIIFRVTRVVIWATEVNLRVIYHASWVSLIMHLVLISAGMHWRFMWGFLTWFVCWKWTQSAVVSKVSWWAPVWRWSAVSGITVGLISTGVRASWSTPMVASTVLMMWPGTSSVGIMMAVTAIPMGIGPWPWSVVSVPVLVMVAWCWSSAVPGMAFWSVMACRCTWGWYLMWTVHHYMSIFITFKAMYIWAMTCCVPWLLTLKTVVFLMGHYIYCRWG